MRKKFILLLTIGVFVMGLSLELSAQSTPALQLQENVNKKETVKTLKAPETVQNIVSKNPIRPLKPTVEKEIQGIEQQLSTLKKITNPSPFIDKKIKHLEGLVAKKKKSVAQAIKSQ